MVDVISVEHKPFPPPPPTIALPKVVALGHPLRRSPLLRDLSRPRQAALRRTVGRSGEAATARWAARKSPG